MKMTSVRPHNIPTFFPTILPLLLYLKSVLKHSSPSTKHRGCRITNQALDKILLVTSEKASMRPRSASLASILEKSEARGRTPQDIPCIRSHPSWQWLSHYPHNFYTTVQYRLLYQSQIHSFILFIHVCCWFSDVHYIPLTVTHSTTHCMYLLFSLILPVIIFQH